MYRAYIDFKYRVRLGDQCSEWYSLLCGIHQGGFLSRTKYVAFINSPILELEKSKLCCQVQSIPASPAGYADDLAAACVSKNNIDRVMDTVNKYGLKWRFRFNAKKSAVLVYGESKTERDIGSANRMYRLGKDRVNERLEYDHVGIKACILSNNSRVEEKIAKGRRALNATAGLGIRRNGLSIATCNMIFWTIVIPKVTFGCELWVLHDNDILKLNAFQRYAGRRVQRFHQRSPSSSSFFGLGWIRIETLILVKKVLFILTLLRMGHNDIVRDVFKARVIAYIQNREDGMQNQYDSPVFDLLNAANRLGLLGLVLDMAAGVTIIISKVNRSKKVWSNAWGLDDSHWHSLFLLNSSNDMLICAMSKSRYLIWWQLADYNRLMQKTSETMVKLISRASHLKADDPTLRDTSHLSRMCANCDLGITENLLHLVMQCPFQDDVRASMYKVMYEQAYDFAVKVNENPQCTFQWLLGNFRDEVETNVMYAGLEIAGRHISKMYWKVINGRTGIG